MHELSLSRSIYGLVSRAAAGRSVKQVYLEVGQLRQVVPASLTHCWGIVTARTALAGSVLVINSIAGVLKCRQCAGRTVMSDRPYIVCQHCGGSDVAVVAGEEFLVKSIDVEGGGHGSVSPAR